MKKYLLMICIFAFVAKSYGQTTESPALTKDYYLKKARDKKTVAFILIGTGSAMIVGGALINLGEGWGEGNQNNGLWLSYTGIGVTLVSIPFFISAHHDKKRALALAFNNQPVFLPKGFAVNTQHCITLRVQL